MKLFVIRDTNNTEEARYWNSTQGFVEREKADVFYEDNLLNITPSVGTELEEVTPYKYLPIQVDIQNEDDTMHRLIKTSDEGRVYIRVGKLDIGIKQSPDGKKSCHRRFLIASPVCRVSKLKTR